MAKTRRSNRKKRAPVDKETSKHRWNKAGTEKQELWLQKEKPCVPEDLDADLASTSTTTTTTTTTSVAPKLYHGYTVEQYHEAIAKMK